jgi:hypothetical protein
MRLPLPFSAAVLLTLGIRAADAADPSLLAATGGFLLGNAYRCDVQAERVTRAGKVIRHMIGAVSQNASEEERADALFTEAFLSSARPDAEENASMPACEAVVTQFERLERRHQQAGFTD